MRTITAIANDMDRIAKHRRDVNKLSGPKLRAYKTLEIELNEAKAAADSNQPSIYLQVVETLKAELEAIR